ncbi:hypothetical protein [Gordonia humi]|uniref:Uncharacterized protein n=2 Tax=Gordonia humi TaxID=686429 RepID=A0A840FBP7_9ACTN|nr:hypothetical protein [Gordonia humi]MBB4136927.1 hypothetical protein [Gordonia humi]
MMQLLFEPATSMFSESDAEADLIAAVGVFVDTGLISPEAANLACADVAAGHSVTTDDGRLRLRAV